MASRPPDHKLAVSRSSGRAGGWSSEDDKPLPEPPYLRKVAEDLWEGSFTLLVWTLAMIVLAIPTIYAAVLYVPLGLIVAALTLAPALAGLMVASGNLARGGFARLSDAARGTFHLYRRSVALALPLAITLALIWFTAKMVSAFPERREMSIVWMCQIGVGLALVLWHLYLFPVLALYDAPFKKTTLLAVVLVGRFVWQTLALLVAGVALLAATMLHPLVWLFVPGVWCVIVMNATWRMARQIVSAKQS